MNRDKYKFDCKKFLDHLKANGISKKQLADIQFCFNGVENVEFGGLNKGMKKGKPYNV